MFVCLILHHVSWLCHSAGAVRDALEKQLVDRETELTEVKGTAEVDIFVGGRGGGLGARGSVV